MPARSRSEPKIRADVEGSSLCEARYVPEGYEPNYAYPLLVWLHGRGADEVRAAELMPALSRRNHVGLALRGPEAVERPGGRIGYGWGRAFREDAPTPDADADLDAALADPFWDLEDAIFAAVRQTRRVLHVHSERVFLLGIGEGGAVALRLGLSHPDRFAGVVAINAWLPPSFRPLTRYPDCRGFRVLLARGRWVSRGRWRATNRAARLFDAAGLDVTLADVPYLNPIPRGLLAGVDAWLVERAATSPVF